MVTLMTPAIIKKLSQRQEQLALTDLEFSKRLGISRALWSMTRKGEKRVGQKLITGIMKAFPDLIPDVLKYLQEGE